MGGLSTHHVSLAPEKDRWSWEAASSFASSTGAWEGCMRSSLGIGTTCVEVGGPEVAVTPGEGW